MAQKKMARAGSVRKPSYSPVLAGACGFVLSSLIPSAAQVVLPQNPSVGQGAVSITQSATATTITQSSQKAVINWTNFSIGSGNSVNFIQPNSSAIVVNRVTGGALSQIDGNLLANGQVWVLNPNGVLIGGGGQINTGGFLATSRALSDPDFLAGRYQFTAPAVNGGRVINRGSIISAPGGYAVMAGQQVNNEGLIQANLGSVVLGGAQTFTLDLTGDKLLSFAVTSPVSLQPATGQGLVQNSGTLQADGGRVQLSARAASDVISNVINTSGLVQANSASLVNGVVVLDGGSVGTVTNSGSITANGRSGGQVTISGAAINQSGRISADGTSTSGGEVKLLATKSIVNTGSISADASSDGSGNGGSVKLIAELANLSSKASIGGSLSAKAGQAGGNGGFIETSASILRIDNAARINTSAPKGQTGLWLLDPTDITITANAADAPSGISNGSTTFPQTTFNDSSISADTIKAALSSSNVVVATSSSGSGEGNINVNAPLSWNANSLVLQAHNNINVNAKMDAGENGSLVFQYGRGTVTGVGSTVNVAAGVEILIPSPQAFQWGKGEFGRLNNLVLQNEFLKFGDGFQASLNADGAPAAPFYRDNTCSSGWCQLSFTTTPLSYAIGFGDSGTGTWNTNGTILKTSDIYSTPTSPASPKIDIAGYKEGTGSIAAIYEIDSTFGKATLRNTYSLGSTDRFLKTESVLFNTGTTELSNIRLWAGISDDFIVASDATDKTEGIFKNGIFSPLDNGATKGNAILVTNPLSATTPPSAVALLYSRAPNIDGVIGPSFGPFSDRIMSTNPTTSPTHVNSTDASYGLFTTLDNLAVGKSVKLVTYFGAEALPVPAVPSGSSDFSALFSASTLFAGIKEATSKITYALASATTTYSGTTQNLSDLIVPVFKDENDTLLSGLNAGDFSYVRNSENVTGFKNVGKYSDISIALLSSEFSLNSTGNANGSLKIDPALLSITAVGTSKTYGAGINLTEFSSVGLVSGEDIGGVTLTSAGAATSAHVGTYSIVPSAASAAGAFDPANYTITYVNGTLNVNPAALTVTALEVNKTYGITANLTQFSNVGLVAGDVMGDVAFASTGAPSTAHVGTYSIVPGAASPASAFSPADYTITYVNGTMNVIPAALTITASNANKTYGNSVNLTQFTSTGLLLGEQVGGVNLASTGSVANAHVGAYSIVPGAATAAGTFDPVNYSITYVNGTLNVNPAPLTITAISASKTFGQLFTPTQFSQFGLKVGDTVTGVTLTSAGSPTSAAVGNYAIVPSAVSASVGFDPANYEINYVNGTLAVNGAGGSVAAQLAAATNLPPPPPPPPPSSNQPPPPPAGSSPPPANSNGPAPAPAPGPVPEGGGDTGAGGPAPGPAPAPPPGSEPAPAPAPGNGPAPGPAPAPASGPAPGPAPAQAPAAGPAPGPAPVQGAAPAPATGAAPAPRTGSAPVAPGNPSSVATAPVAPPPPSPVGTVKPPTPKDAADSGDKTLAAAPPPPPPASASQPKRSATPAATVKVGMVDVQTVAQAPTPAAAGSEQRFSLGGNSASWQ